MKDKNGIEICCENCDDFTPVGTNGRGCALYEEDCENVFGEKRCIFRASSEALEARIAELQAENALLKENFTIEEIEFIKKAISMAILDCETNPPKPSDEKINLMWSIKAKCDELLKQKINNE